MKQSKLIHSIAISFKLWWHCYQVLLHFSFDD